MIKLMQPPPTWGIPNISPACMKLETWLRMAGLSYEIVPFDLTAAPKGKVPYIEEQGALIGDSTLIIEHLTKTHGRDLDEGLSSVELAIALAFRRLLKENSYWVMAHNRYGDEVNWPIYREMIIPMVAPDQPREVQEQAAEGFRGVILGQLKSHGLGRHSSDEIYRIGVSDLRAVADYLGDKPFFMGERPTVADATVYAYVSNLVSIPLESPVKQYSLSRPNLTEYLKRMKGRFFP